MGKNIALFIDGTWNKPVDRKPVENTNVRKLYEICAETRTQTTHYLSGVGADLRHKASGGLFGRGMKDLIKKAYAFLSLTYDRGDSIFLFGFSRGAFAARSLAGFVDRVGLLLKDKPDRLDDAYELYEHRPQHGQLQLRSFLRRVADVPAPAVEVTDLPIYFIGVWDTVAALGLPGRGHKYSAPFTEYHQTELPLNITHARHALALHELRQPFEPLLWMGPSASRQTLKQVWFPGAHGDVGGGYRETEWSGEALRWMADEARDKGLKLNNTGPPDALKDYGASIHHAIRGWFVGFKPTMRSLLADRLDLAQPVLDTFSVHPSALHRLLQPAARHYQFKRPDVNQRLREIDEESLQLLLEIKFEHAKTHPMADLWTSARVAEVEGASDTTTRFINGVGKPSHEECNTFIRSLCLPLLCGNQEPLIKVPATITTIINSKRELLAQPEELNAILSWCNERLAAIIDSVKQSASLLPEWAQGATTATEMEQQRVSLLTAIKQARLKATRPGVFLRKSPPSNKGGG